MSDSFSTTNGTVPYRLVPRGLVTPEERTILELKYLLGFAVEGKVRKISSALDSFQVSIAKYIWAHPADVANCPYLGTSPVIQSESVPVGYVIYSDWVPSVWEERR